MKSTCSQKSDRGLVFKSYIAISSTKKGDSLKLELEIVLLHKFIAIKKIILLWAFISTGWYFTILLPPILFSLAKKVWDSLLQGPVGVSWISDSSKTLSSSAGERKNFITCSRVQFLEWKAVNVIKPQLVSVNFELEN